MTIMFTAGVPPYVTILIFRIAWSAFRIWRARKGGTGMLTLKFPRAKAAAAAGPLFVPGPVPVAMPAPEPRTSLCTGCVYAHIVEGYEPGERMVFCGYAYPQREVPF